MLSKNSGLQRRGLLEVSIVTRCPVIGSRTVMGSPSYSDMEQTPHARLRSNSIEVVVTGQLLHQDAHIPKAGEA
jgi:hypothetical protein